MSYKVKFYKGDYSERQSSANQDGAVAYIEHHFNSSELASAGYSVVVVGSNASQTSKNWGIWYASAVARAFNTNVGGTRGIVVGGFDGRGDGNIKHTKMPALLLEPLFASNLAHAAIIRSERGQMQLAEILVESIQRFFPDGGLIAFSVGHKYKASKPADRGAELAGGGVEADYAEMVLLKAQIMLEQITVPKSERTVRVSHAGEVVFSRAIDEDATVVWDSARGILTIKD